LDGIYKIRTDLEKDDVLSAKNSIVTYKSMSQMERAF